MGARGPAPKPAELRAIEGGAGKGGRDLSHRPPKRTPKYAPLTNHAPDWIPPEGRAEWRRLMAEFERIPGLVQRPDRALLTAWCLEWAHYVEASKDISEKGTVIRGRKNPSVQIARDSLEKLISISSRFGLTPGDRARLNIGKGEGGDESPISALLTGGGE